MKTQIEYSKLHKYKYRLERVYTAKIPIYPTALILTSYFTLNESGFLCVSAGYCWDGPSWPAIDTKTFMRGSLVHDVLAQCMRLGYLDYKEWLEPSNRLLQQICIEDGMWRIRAWWVYKGVSLFDGWAKPTKKPEIKIIVAP